MKEESSLGLLEQIKLTNSFTAPGTMSIEYLDKLLKDMIETEEILGKSYPKHEKRKAPWENK